LTLQNKNHLGTDISMREKKDRKSLRKKIDPARQDYTITPLPEGVKVRRRKPWLQDWIEAILFAFVVAMIIRNYTFQNFVIPSSSMEKTLLVGDYLVANKLKYFFTDPKREEIVTFRYPKIEEGTPEHPASKGDFIEIFHPIYINKATSFSKFPLTFMHITYYARKNVVKRVIGMPGDTLEVRDKIVYINGERFERGYECYDIADPAPPLSPVRIFEHRYAPGEMDIISHNPWYKDYVVQPEPSDSTEVIANRGIFNRDWFGPIRIPEGKYFVLGDNRDVSEDSRYWGFLDRSDITGTPWVIFFSKGIEYNKLYDVPHTRWDRIFRLAR
jgi:signal peptidase I